MTINLEAEAATREENNVALIAALDKVLARGVLVAVVEVLQNLLPNLIVRVSHPHPLRIDPLSPEIRLLVHTWSTFHREMESKSAKLRQAET